MSMIQNDQYSLYDRGYSNRVSTTMSWADELEDMEDAPDIYCKVSMVF